MFYEKEGQFAVLNISFLMDKLVVSNVSVRKRKGNDMAIASLNQRSMRCTRKIKSIRDG
jgi:hypothetical protein